MPRRACLRLDPLESCSVPAVLTVTSAADAGPGTLREAVALANDEATHPDPDAIHFAPNLFGQTISLSTPADSSLGNSALLVSSDVTLDGFAGYSGSGPGVTIIRQTGVSDLRLFLVTTAGRLTLDGLTVAGGLARGGQGGDGFSGGGGGAGLGGAVFNRGTLTVTRSLFTDNQAVGGSGGALDFGFRYGWTPGGPGGGTYGGGSGTAGGFGGGGGGGGPSGQFPMPVTRRPGGAGGFGGGGGGGAPAGVGGFGGAAGTDRGGGGAGLGGAVFNYGGTVVVQNSTFANNAAIGGGPPASAGAGLGGGLFNLNGTASVTNCTFAGNAGGAVYVLAHPATGGVENAAPASLTLVNSILANSLAGTDLTVNPLAGSGGATSNVVRTIANSSSLSVNHADPGLLPLADNGGPTRTMTPRGVFVVRDTGTTAFDPGGTDQRGFPRVLGPTVDLGAIELPPARPLAVTPATPPGGDTVLRLADAVTGQVVRSFVPFPTFGGVVHAAVADVNADGIADVVVGAGAGGPHVKVFDGATWTETLSFYAYDPAFTGGVNVAAGDVNADGVLDIVTGAGPGGGPHVKMFNGKTGAEEASFYAYDPAFTGGVNVAVGNENGDGWADIVTGAGAGGGPHVKVFDGRTFGEIASFYAYDPAFAGGVSVAAGNMFGDGRAEVITGAGAGGGPNVKVFDELTGTEKASIYAYDPSFAGGVSVAAGDVNNDGRAEIVTGVGPGGGPNVKVFGGLPLFELASFFPLDESFHGGVLVG